MNFCLLIINNSLCIQGSDSSQSSTPSTGFGEFHPPNDDVEAGEEHIHKNYSINEYYEDNHGNVRENFEETLSFDSEHQGILGTIFPQEDNITFLDEFEDIENVTELIEMIEPRYDEGCSCRDELTCECYGESVIEVPSNLSTGLTKL